MRTEEIDEERARSGWNPYEGEEEPIGGSGSEAEKADSAYVRYNQEQSREPIEAEKFSTGEEHPGKERCVSEEDLSAEERRISEEDLSAEERRPLEEKHPGRERHTLEDDLPAEEKQRIWQLQEQEEDLRRMQAMYPHTAKILLPYIEAACDELEYEGSMMYDLRPDYETVLRIKEAVQQKAGENFPPMEPEERDELLTMQYHHGPRRRPGGNWLGDFIQTMLLEEMHRRRCRRCRMR